MSKQSGFYLGSIYIDLERSCLEGESKTLELEPRVREVLEMLLERRGAVVTRDELIETVWSGFPGADQSLTNAVSKFRAALREVGGDPGIIKTIPKRGYSLVIDDLSSAPPARSRRFVWLLLPMILVLGLEYRKFKRPISRLQAVSTAPPSRSLAQI